MAELKHKEFAIVVLATIAGDQISPTWLRRKKLISDEEAEKANIMTRTQELSAFNVGSINFLINQQRVQLSTEDLGNVLPMFDICESIFRILSSVLIRSAGFNTSAHYSVKNVDEWHRIGHKMAPKENWNAILKNPGLLTVRMQGQREDGRDGMKVVIVEPSTKLAPGVFIHINDHININGEVGADDGVTSMLELMAAMKRDIIANSKELEEQVLA